MDREQAIEFGPIRRVKLESGEPPHYFLSGKRMYEIGAISGEYPPMGWRRPGFLVGKPLPEFPMGRPEAPAHLLSEMGGVWSHPIKAIEGLHISIEEERQTWTLLNSIRFVNHFAYADFYYEANGISVHRRDFIAEEDPALFIKLQVRNNRDRPVRLRVSFSVTVNLRPSWFSGLTNGPDELLFRDGLMLAYDAYWPEQWGLAFGSELAPIAHPIFQDVARRVVGTLSYEIHLPPGGSSELPFLLVAEHQKGYPEALRRFRQLIGRREELFAEKTAYYEENVFGGTVLDCSDRRLAEAFYIAKANLLWLMSGPTPYLRRYLYGGIPEYVQLFGTDTEYSIPGITAVDFREAARESLLNLAWFADMLCGRVPHEVTTNGHVFHPGNTQETPGFTIAVWNYYKWTGDKLFLDGVYPLCQEGVMDYVLAHWDMDLDYYPDGNSMVERLGMGSEKLDSVCYFCHAIYCLSYMAEALGRLDDRDRQRELADTLRSAINEDFWNEAESMWADSLTEEHTQKLDGHWIVAVPMETGVAEVEKGSRALDRIEKEWVNELGMVHTKDKENIVWTLPTGVLAMAEFRYGRGEMGARLTADITKTLEVGPLGTFKELIPEGLCFVQLWSPAIFLQGVIEGIFGINPRADLDRAEIVPMVPHDWKYAKLDRVAIGEHSLDIHFRRSKEGEKVVVTHRSEGANFHCSIGFFAEESLGVVSPPELIVLEQAGKLGERRVQYVEVDLAPDEGLEVRRSKRQVAVVKRSKRRVKGAQKARAR